jgi:hypothetical protein
MPMSGALACDGHLKTKPSRKLNIYINGQNHKLCRGALVKDGFRKRSANLNASVLSLSIFVIIFFLINLLIWFPGIPNSDSDAQYLQVATGEINDWHPPVMTRLWEGLLLFGKGTGPIFAVHILAYWAAAIIMAAALLKRGNNTAAWLLIGAWSTPTFIMQNINITKDMSLAVALFLSFSIVFYFRTSKLPVPKWALICAALLLLYGALVRTNAVFAVGPLFAYYVRPSWLLTPLRLAVASALLSILLVPMAGAVNRYVLLAHDAGAIRSLQLFDISGIADRTADMAVFGTRSTIVYSEVHRCYSPIMWDTLNAATCTGLIGKIGRANGSRFMQLPPLSDLWIKAIFKHPMAYAAHRFTHFNSTTYFLVPPRHLEAVRVFETAGSRAPSFKNRVLDLIRYFPLLMPSTLLAIGLGLFAVLLRDNALTKMSTDVGLPALLISALSYGFSFLIVGVATDLRYFLYPDMAMVLALLLAAQNLWQDRREQRSLPLYVTATGFVAVIACVTFGSRAILPAPKPISASVKHLTV